MPDWVELPTDIGVAVASSPYRNRQHRYRRSRRWPRRRGVGLWSPEGLDTQWRGRSRHRQRRRCRRCRPVPVERSSASGLARAGTRCSRRLRSRGRRCRHRHRSWARSVLPFMAVAKQPLENTVPVDVGLHMLGLPPIATGTARTARIVAPAILQSRKRNQGPPLCSLNQKPSPRCVIISPRCWPATEGDRNGIRFQWNVQPHRQRWQRF